MEQLINNMLANVQVPQIPQVGKKGEGSQKDGFQKLLEQKQSADTQAAPKREEAGGAQKPQDAQEGVSAEKPQQTEQPQQVQAGTKEGRELEEQMALAAMMLLRNPLAADIAEETPQVLTDPNWEDGLVPVGHDDYAEQGIRIVHWMQPEAESQDLEGLNEAAGQWIEAQTEAEAGTEAAPEVQAAVPEAAQEAEAPVMEVKVETGGVSQEGDAEDSTEPQGAETEAPVFEDVKAVPVKVGEAPKNQKAEQPVEEQVAPKLAQALQEGDTRVEIQLTPENLGKITVEMTQGKDGGLVVQIHAEERGTQELLSKNTANLAELLGRETSQEVRVEVPRQEESQRQDLYEQQQEQQRRHQQEQRQKHEASSEDFLQQLRLGLIPLDGE